MLWELDGTRPQLASEVWIAPGCHVIGKVSIGPGTSIWFGAVLRGDNEMITIGSGTSIQENCVLHTDMRFPMLVGSHCIIGHGAILHGCTIGEGSLIGMGATVLNGARIGNNCLIGAGALVTEGTVIPDGMLVMGSPARVIRPLTEEVKARLIKGASNYQAKARLFREKLRPM